jgi:hypothetical protein
MERYGPLKTEIAGLLGIPYSLVQAISDCVRLGNG